MATSQTAYTSYPKDGDRATIATSVPNKPAIAVTYETALSSSVEVALDAATTWVEVTAIDKAVLVKWGTTDASTSAFDEVVPLNSSKAFFVPIDSSTGSLYGAVNVIEQTTSAAVAVIEK